MTSGMATKGQTTVWDVYEKTLEMRSKTIRDSLNVPLKTIADELQIEPDIAEECAIVLQQLSLVHFDTERMEIAIA